MDEMTTQILHCVRAAGYKALMGSTILGGLFGTAFGSVYMSRLAECPAREWNINTSKIEELCGTGAFFRIYCGIL